MDDENIEKHMRCDTPSLARCFPDIAFVDIQEPLLRRMAYTVVALHIAAHNCDFYITKYQSKALEQLQNLVTQYATGIRRLEEEEKEAMASGAQQMSTKERARKVTIRLQSAANRCHWFSSTELAVFVLTEGTCWQSHNEVPMFISKYIFMLNECRRLLEDRTPGLLEAARVDINAWEFQPDTGMPLPAAPPREQATDPASDSDMLPPAASATREATDSTKNTAMPLPAAPPKEQATDAASHSGVLPPAASATRQATDTSKDNDTPPPVAPPREEATDAASDDSELPPAAPSEAGSDTDPASFAASDDEFAATDQHHNDLDRESDHEGEAQACLPEKSDDAPVKINQEQEDDEGEKHLIS